MDPSSSSSSNKRKRGLDSYDEPGYKRPKYDVFVNYATEDLGKRFVSHLKGALGREGFTICDHTMLPLGQDESSELLKAIEDSELYLLVFSNEYASSVRCLEEFARIMESYHKYKHRKVLPVFFNVEATDVKNRQGPFLDSFKDHETKVDPNKVQKWRQALREAGHLSGLNLKDWRDENQLIREIIKDASKMKNPQQLCDVEHPVGIESRAQDIISALRLSDPDFSMVAVLGISGSGKTTIVKAVYDRIAADFDVSCFIQDINSYVYRGPNWKVDLQKDVISCLTGNDNYISFRNNDGAAKIKKLISGQKLFLVLDDVYTFEQLQALSIPSASFHCESRIIVTTRNRQSLSNLQHTSYNIELLDTSESFELFTRLIGKGDPIDKKFVDAIVRCAGGIPLVLEVWSRHFTCYDRNLWPSMLEMLKRIPHEDTQKKLRISYDSLPKRAQNLFLDIACFFHGMSKDLVVEVLQDEDFFPDFEIQNLVHKFLVKPSDDEYDLQFLLLHDVIREMGQEVVRQEDEDEPGKRTRLMGQEVVRVLGDCSGTDSVRSILLGDMKEEATVQLEAFKKMSSLRFIMLYNYKLQWSSSSNDDMSACFSFKHLKYLEWTWFPCKSLDNIDMGNVVVIILQNSNLEKLWEGVKSFKKLKILDVSRSYLLTKTGNFIGLENLEKLDLRGCENLEELDSSIGCLQKLVELDLSYCSRLKRLPWESIGKLTSLQNLNLYYCSSIPEISHEIGILISLKHLNLRNTRFNNLPNSLCQLHQLTHIYLSYCTNLKSIPDLPLNIQYVEASYCRNLVNLPSNCSELQFLTLLYLDDCCKLGSEGFTQVVTRLRNLQILRMRNCNISKVSSGIGNLVSLRLLHLSFNTFSSLPESFNNLSQLEELNIYGCSELRLLPLLPSQLTDIEAAECWSLDVMPYDSRQKAYTFPSKVFKELLTSNKGLCIGLSEEELPESEEEFSESEEELPESEEELPESEEELPEWCTYRNSGNVLSFVAPLKHFDNKICGVIFCAIDFYLDFLTIHNKTKEKSHRMEIEYHEECTLKVVFYPLNDKTLVVEAGDTVELRYDRFKTCGLRLVYEDEVVDSGLVLKEVRKPTLSLFPLSSESDIMTGNSITELNDEDVCSFPIQNDEEYTYYDFFPMVS